MWGYFPDHISNTVHRFRRNPKPTKNNIKDLINDQKKRIEESKRSFEGLAIRDMRLTQSIVNISTESHILWHDLQDINQGNLQSTRLRTLKAEINQVLDDCLRSGTIANLRALSSLTDPELTTFLRELERHRQGFNREKIEKIPFFLYKPKQNSQSQDMCSICHESYEEGVECISLECKHIFHRKCISTWLRLKTNCPLCKKQVKPSSIPNPSASNNNPPPSNNSQNERQNNL